MRQSSLTYLLKIPRIYNDLCSAIRIYLQICPSSTAELNDISSWGFFSSYMIKTPGSTAVGFGVTDFRLFISQTPFAIGFSIYGHKNPKASSQTCSRLSLKGI
jgi:hypothetical protein